MNNKVRNPKALRRSNKSQILWHLYNRGPLSRLQLASLCHLTTPSITQLMQDLLIQDEVMEIGAVQRNQTGRREVLVDINYEKDVALGVNVEEDYTDFCVGNLKQVFYKERVLTPSLRLINGVDKLFAKMDDIMQEFAMVNQICVGIAGKVSEGIVLNSYGIMAENFDLQKAVEERYHVNATVVNCIKAQAMSLYKEGNENYLYVKHSPNVGSAMVIKGELVKGNDKVTGELGHVIMELDGKPCKCGKHGCLDTIASDEAIVDNYKALTGKEMSVDEIYALYGVDEQTTNYLDEIVIKISLNVANVNETLNPDRVFVTGGLFANENTFNKGMWLINSHDYKIELQKLDKTDEIRTLAEVKYCLVKSLLEV